MSKEVLKKNIPTMGIKALKELIKLKIKSGELTSLLIVGGHGIGKSEAVFQATEEMGFNLTDKRLSCIEVGDMVGIPTKGKGNVTVWLKPDWFPVKGMKKFENHLLFLDEFMRANRDIKNASMQVILDRRLNGWELPDDCLVVAAINDGDMYDMVGGLDQAQQDRFETIELAPTAEEWVEWAKETKVFDYIVNFISQNKEYLDPPNIADDDLERVNKYPSRRSWVKLSKMLKYLEKKPTNDQFALVASYVGNTAATNFIMHCDKVLDNIPAEDVMEGKDVFTGKNDYWKDITKCIKTIDGVVDIMKSKFVDENDFSNQDHTVTDDEFKAIAMFFKKLSGINQEAAAKFYVLLKKNANSFVIHKEIVKKYKLQAVHKMLFDDITERIKNIKENKKKKKK